MPISITHERLVSEVVKWIRSEFGTSDLVLYTDAVNGDSNSHPPNIDGFIPDVYGRILTEEYIIVGEAKTPGDLEREHTYMQLGSFIRHVAAHGGGILILATQWPNANCAKAIVRILKKKYETNLVTTKVLDQLSVE